MDFHLEYQPKQPEINGLIIQVKGRDYSLIK